MLGTETMIRMLIAAVISIVSAAGGYYVGAAAQAKPIEFKADFVERETTTHLENGMGVQCKALADAFLSEHRIGERSASARATAGTDTASISLSADGQSLTLLTAASVRSGTTEADPMLIIERTPNFVVAAKLRWPEATVVFLDLRTRKALWSSSAVNWTGMLGQTLYFECR